MLTPLESTLIFIVLMTVFIVPFVVYNKMAKRKNAQKRTQKFTELEQQYQVHITEKDQLDSLIIGLDKEKGSILYYHLKTEEAGLIPLDQLSHSTVFKTSEQGYTTEIRLVFHFKNKKETSISFYKKYREDTLSLPQLAEKAEYWKSRAMKFADRPLSAKQN